ncbi:hypothetical protein D910_08770 [Dendroctonus ponderosae]|uniref:Uncharacterized protein n=1 Tax=Dendroctonus ponderosae TaxID=77166 RepID=U4UN57_DENPD|nr:hypothetical protein D910_08770 [Dendroctonus ponderosae]
MGLSALERWQQAMDKAVFEVLLLQVIPYLDSYLRSKSMGGLAQGILVDKRRKTARMLKKRIVLYEFDPELVEFQTRILRFVGKQNSKICQAFVSADSGCAAKITSDTLHLKVMLPFNDLVLDIHLEPFVMRVIDICLNSSDRKNRVMACELLQAFVVIFLGRAKALPATSQSDLDELLKSIAMPLLHLACDMDQVVRQIFEPLFMQIIHWYTSKTQRQGPHLAVIIDVLMDGVTHSTNASLRDFSGKCINEFVKWSIKQYSDNDLKNNPESIKVLVDKMRFFSRHPDLVKKIGAALIFNNIYKEIREKRTLISLFAVEILHLFVISLDLLEHSNEEVDSTVFQIRNSINHLKRIFIEKSNLFRELEQPKRESDASKDIRFLLIRKSRLNQLFKAEDFSVGQIDKLLSYFLKETSQVSETNEICIARTSEATTEYCKLVFEFALTERPQLSALITHLYKNIMVRNQEHDNVQPTRLGLYLLLEFSDPIVRALVDGFDLFLESFEFTDLTIKIISELLKYLDRNKQTNPKESFQTMSMKILENWPLFQVCFERYGIEAGSPEQLRILKCGVYKALASIITNSFNTKGFFEKLFVREENNEDILWSALIDLNVTYSFPVDFDNYPKRRKILINIRNELRQQQDQDSQKSFNLLDILLQSQPEIAVDSALISTVSQQSSLMSVGALLIEEYLINGEVLPVPSKRGIINESGENTHWLKLAELYRELDEWDMVKAIFIEKTNCKESVARAIALESQNKWQNAAEEYKTLIETDLSLEKRDFYCESLFKCLANLGSEFSL